VPRRGSEHTGALLGIDLVVGDLDAADLDGDGFGELLVGANRDDVGGVCEAGRGSLFSGSTSAGTPLGPHPSATFTRRAPAIEDLTAYRFQLADLIGSPEREVVLGGLSSTRAHGLMVWDGAAGFAMKLGASDAAPSDLFVPAIAGHGGHFCGGFLAADLGGAGRDERILGGYDYGPVPLLEVGRVVVTFWP